MKNYLFCFLLLLVSSYNYAQSRFLDSTFGNDGKVVTDFGSAEGINSIAFQSDKKIVAAGYYDLIKKNISFDFYVCALARYQTNGKLDSSFGENGFIHFNNRFSGISAILTQKNDKIVGTGNADAYGGERSELVVLQWKQNGEFDSSFGENGVASYGSYPYSSVGNAIALQSDGKILAAGIESTFNSWDSVFIVVARFNKNGTPDTGFSNNGKKKISVGFHSYATGITVNSTGEIIIAGYNTTQSGFSQPVLIGLTSSGKLNKNFGNNGIATVQLNDNASIASIVLTKDEKIIAGGTVQLGDNNNFLLIKYNSNGTVDSSFGINGIVNSDLKYSDQVTSIAIQPDEKIIAAGNSFDAVANETYFALSRYSGDGMPDSTFGLQGRILTAFSGHTNTLSKILLQPDGKITAGGTSSIRRYGYGDFALSRYTNDSNEDTGLQIPIALNPDNRNEKSTVLVTSAK